MGRTEQLCQWQAAWGGMDACTRCGEAIPVAWARNTDDRDPSGPTHTLLTQTHPADR